MPTQRHSEYVLIGALPDDPTDYDHETVDCWDR